jgi:hypothetical protein
VVYSSTLKIEETSSSWGRWERLTFNRLEDVEDRTLQGTKSAILPDSTN